MTANSWSMFYDIIILCIISLIRGHEFTVEMTIRYRGSLFWFAIFSSVLAFTVFLMLVGRIGSGKAGYATAIFPIGALFISTLKIINGTLWRSLVSQWLLAIMQ